MNTLPRALVILFTSLLMFSAQAAERYIAVTGEGQIEAMPDYLRLQLSISAEAPTTAAAKTQVDQAMKALLATAQGFNIADTDIDAATLTSQSLYDWNNGKSTKRGEQVSRSVNLKLRDLTAHTELLHQLLQISALQVQHTQLNFNDPAALQLEATALALTQAKHKATVMATTLESRLGKVLSIEENNSANYPMAKNMRMLSSAPMADSTPAPMLVQKQSISSTVQVRFELK